MTTLTPARRTLALLALALGGFAIGSTEFVAMGLLPNIASALLPGLYHAHPAQGLAHAGWLVSAYALGVVVGAPTIAATTSHLPRKRLLLILLIAFSVGTVASAVLPTFGWVLLARFAAGLPHGAYFGIASIVAADIMGPGNRGKGVAMVMGGLTVANIVGVPAITWVGQVASWRVAYGVVALLFVATFAAVLALVPMQPADHTASISRELRAFRTPQVWIVMGLAAIGFGGFFAVYSYVSPVVVHVTGLPESVVPFVLMAIGVGMTVGNIVGGLAADRSVKATMYIGFAVLMLSLGGFAAAASSPVGIFVAAFFLGGSMSAISPSVQTRLMDVAGDAKTIAAALNHSAFNVGNSIGAFLGGLVIAAGFGYRAPALLGVALAIIGVAITTVSFAVQRRSAVHEPAFSDGTRPPTAPIAAL
jgi:DHA1 family inner membrane transport protein